MRPSRWTAGGVQLLWPWGHAQAEPLLLGAECEPRERRSSGSGLWGPVGSEVSASTWGQALCTPRQEVLGHLLSAQSFLEPRSEPGCSGLGPLLLSHTLTPRQGRPCLLPGEGTWGGWPQGEEEGEWATGSPAERPVGLATGAGPSGQLV